jgi:hypothetical protein
MKSFGRKLRAWRRKHADKLQRIAERLDAQERSEWIWDDPLTLEWRAKLDAGEKGQSK